MDTIAQFRLSNAGLGNRQPRWPSHSYLRRTFCPFCPTLLLTEYHVVFVCSSVEKYREELDLTFFRGICKSKGFSEQKTFFLFVNGHDWNENVLPASEFPSRGLSLDIIRGHWLSLWWLYNWASERVMFLNCSLLLFWIRAKPLDIVYHIIKYLYILGHVSTCYGWLGSFDCVNICQLFFNLIYILHWKFVFIIMFCWDVLKLENILMGFILVSLV